MSDSLQNFEFILRKRCNNKPSALYSDVKNQSKRTYKPKDVIASVSSQLNAIYSADCIKSNKRVSDDLKKVKTSTFLSVNNLPVTHNEPPKHTAKFDTQCVTDTQLITIIEDAEIQNAHIGMTQEFETAFIHTKAENCDLDADFKESTLSEVDDMKNMVEFTEEIEQNNEHFVNKHDIRKVNIDNKDSSIKNTNKTAEYRTSKENKIDSNLVEELQSNTQAELSQILQSKKQKDEADNFKNRSNIQEEPFSQILQTITINNKLKNNKPASDRDSDIQDTAIDECSELLNQCIEIEDNENTERPPSPVFESKHVNIKTKTPSPLVFNLDKFENFESIAISLLETHDFNTARHLINSQILNKELHLKIDDEIEFNDRDIFNTDFGKKEDVIESIGSPIIDGDIEVIEIDKKISDDILNQLNKQNAGAKAETTSDVFKDEILFSSDEEDDYIHKECQDLPFTCALETSFYNQSDVLDKNMYVGFQTASNRSIQVCAESFARAKSILSDAADDNITVTELVKNCESAVKHNSDGEQAKRDLSEKSVAFNLTEEKSVIAIADGFNKPPVKVINKEMLNVDLKTRQDKNNLMGFMTANNKKINLSEKALARCKKVFQDIDLNEDFDCVNENLQKIDTDFEKELKINNLKSDGTEVQNTKAKVNPIDDEIEGIDEDIIQEFENIEMSLKDDVKEGTELIILSKSMQILENVCSDYDTMSKEKAFTKIIDAPETVLSQIIGNSKPKTANSNIGFKTASNKNIKISEEAWVKSKNIFENLDAIELPKKSESLNDKVDLNKVKIIKPYKEIDTTEEVSKMSKYALKENNDKINTEVINLPSTSKGFVGFKTADNNNINISKGCNKMFDNIDSIELPKKDIKTFSEDRPETESMNEETHFSISHDRFVGFKTADNKNIHISAEALAKTKGIFNDIDAPDYILPVKRNKDPLDVRTTQNVEHIEIKSKRVKSMGFAGFKSASNKVIKVSEKALVQTKNFFKELQSDDLEVAKEMLNEKDIVDIANEIVCETGFVGFKTANNKNIKISGEAFAKTKNIFKDLGQTDVKQGTKTKDHYPDIEIYHNTAENYQLLINKDEANKNSKQEINAPEFKGFKTASNKMLKVTSEALIKTKNIFKDIDINNDFNIKDNTNEVKDLYPKELFNNEPTSPVFKGFQTANKTPVSAKALEKGKTMFENLDKPNSNFTGFQTASNKRVKISEKALANSRKIFKDIAIHDDIEVSSKQVKKKDLYPKEILQEKIDEEDANLSLIKESKEMVPQFKGFQTASKKSVAISKSALARSKEIFQDLDINNDNVELKEICGNKTPDKIVEDVLMKAVDTLKSNSFLGFQTANDKKVTVSEDALAKSKKLFQDIDNIEHEKAKRDIVKTPSNFQTGFQTGNNKSIGVSDEALARSKRLFTEIEEENANTNKKCKNSLENEEVHAIIDTQVLNNFEQSLYTEDFQKSPHNTKRAGSPILSCPRAKKRKKFETPYNINNIQKPTPILKELDEKETKKITFNHDYKKNKQYTLKDLNNMAKNMTKKLDPYILKFDYDDLLLFVFNDNRNDLTDGNLTIHKLKELFLNSVNSKLVPKGWIENHLKLILWKLISYEVKYKLFMCTARNVLDQLKYRYDKELYNSQRPALRKIFERDDVPSKTMVLCVVGLYTDGVKVSSVPNTATNVELLLTDGWYCIYCNIDRMLTELVCSGSIRVGSKIVTSGAELTGCEQGVSPLEDTSAVRLKIFGNSTRRARWDARLGYHGNSAILCQLSSVKVLGGKVSKLRVYVTRVYPALYVEKFEDGSTVTRSERLENLHQMKTEAERQVFMEKLYEEVEREFADQESQDSEGLSDSYKKSLDSGSQIAMMMKRSKDPAEYRAQLTNSQRNLLEAHTTKSRDKLLQDIQTRVRDKVEKAGVCVSRNVVSLLKIRVAGLSEKDDGVSVTKGIMSIWKPNDAIQEIIREGAWIDVLNVVPTAVRYSEIQISAGRQSIFSTSKTKEPEKFKQYTKLLQRQSYPLKDLAQTPYMTTDYNEIDTVGLIFSIEPPNKEFDSTKQSFQNLYLSDAEKNIICVNFWGGLIKFGFQNVLDTGQVIACVNLQKRAGNTRKSIPHFRVTEFSYFTQTPKFDNVRRMVNDLNKKLNGLDRRKFCQDCIVLKNNYSLTKNNENVSPYRFTNTDINISKNKIFIDSPLARQNKFEDNFNLSGIDFESTFKQDSELSEEMLLRKKKVNEKIARLKMYGEPPPLSPLHIINRSKQACSSYKSPLLSNNNNSKIENDKNLFHSKSDSSINVATVNNTPQKCVESEISNSPILLNRTYVKSVNPIKINFDVQDNNDSTVDHFGDEFEGSPPLSLD